MERSYVIKMGGSLLFENNAVRVDRLTELSNIFKASNKIKAIIMGGGILARIYIKAAREININESICDLMGIDVSRVNSRLLIGAIGDKAYPKPAHTLEDAMEYATSGKIVVLGGITPGQSTTSVTFEIAEALNASDLLILTNVDGIYDKDPRKYPDAKKIDEMSVNEIETQFLTSGDSNQSAAGEYRIMDATSIQIFKRSNLNVQLLSGENDTALTDILINGSEKRYGTQFKK